MVPHTLGLQGQRTLYKYTTVQTFGVSMNFVIFLTFYAHQGCIYFIFTCSHLAETFIQSNLQMRTMYEIKINKRAIICKCYDMSQLA